MNYQVADYIIRIKNASMANRRTVHLVSTKMNKSIGKVLVKAGYLESVKEVEEDGRNVLIATLRYDRRQPVITDVAVVSKPSLRVYRKGKVSPNEEKRGVSISVLSTSQGIMTSHEARKKGIGGEVLFRIW